MALANYCHLLGMKPFNQPFDMITMLGFLILMGTVINNPILVVERAVYLRDKDGYPLIDAIKRRLVITRTPYHHHHPHDLVRYCAVGVYPW